MGFSWKFILKYENMIHKIALKYSGDPTLAEDVVQETMLKLFEDKTLSLKKFDPAKQDAAVRQVIRNKVLNVLASKKIGRWTVDSLDMLAEFGYQIDTNGQVSHWEPKLPFSDKDEDLNDN